MKTTEQIQRKCDYLESVILVTLKKEHNDLIQLDQFGGVGAKLRKDIAEIEGKIIALKWVLENDII